MEHHKKELFVGLKRKHKDSTSWVWVNGEIYTMNKQDWNKGEPNNWTDPKGNWGPEDCVVMFTNRLYNDFPCNKTKLFPLICQFPTCRGISCSNNGKCSRGKCECKQGFIGHDCSQGNETKYSA